VLFRSPASAASVVLLMVLLGGCTTSEVPADQVQVSTKTEESSLLLQGGSRRDSHPGRPIPSPVERVVVPEGVTLVKGNPGYRLYAAPTTNPREWIRWFSQRFPVGEAFYGWMYCGGGDGSKDMSRSWTKRGRGLLLNVGFVPTDGTMEIIVYRGKFNDCEHHD
jgi:hypothetical protein